MTETRAEIKKCLDFAISKAKPGATFLFGEKVMNAYRDTFSLPSANKLEHIQCIYSGWHEKLPKLYGRDRKWIELDFKMLFMTQ